jgi:calcium-dependent protein kinase
MHHFAMYFEANDWIEVLQSMDVDGNGKIDFTEFIAAAYNKQKLLNEENLHTAFKIFDMDGDG